MYGTWLLALAFIGWALPALAGELDTPVPVVSVRRLPRGADVARTIWTQPPNIPRMEHYVFDDMPEADAQAEVRLAYDAEALYVAFRCFVEDPQKIQTKQTRRDSAVWRDDSLSLYLDTLHDHRTYFHLEANAAGVQYDERDRPHTPTSWDGDWRVETAREAYAWTALLTIPFRTLGVNPPPVGTVWGANFGRRCDPNQASIWATIRGSLLDLDRWGHLVFAGADTPIITSSLNDPKSPHELAPVGTRAAGTCGPPATAIGAPGRHPHTLSVWNPTQKPLRLRAEMLWNGQPFSRHTYVAPPGASQWSFAFWVPFEGEHRLAVSVYEANSGHLLMRSASVPVYVPRLRTALRRYRQLVEALRPPSSAATSEKGRILRRLEEMDRKALVALGDNTQWRTLFRSLEALEKEIGHVRALCADPQGRGYAVGTETALRKVLRDRLFEGPFGKTLRIELARNEREAGQVVIVAYGRALSGVAVSASDLVGPSGAVIPAKEIRLERVDFVKTGWPRYAVEYAGWWPDPLMPIAPFDVPQGRLQPIWVTVFAPAHIPAGTYRGRIQIQPANAPPTEVPLEVAVWDITLPTTGHMKTAFSLFLYELSAWYGRPVDAGMRREWYQFLLERRINPTNIYSKTPQPDWEDIPFCVERGMNAFTLACTWHKDPNEPGGIELARLIEEYRALLLPRGWWPLAFLYGFDEVDYTRYQELRDTYGWIHQRFPDLKRVCTVRPLEELKGSVDIWVPLTANFVPSDADDARRAGDEVWTYVCCHPFHPWANFFVDYPAIDPRILCWQNWKFHATGLLYYAMNLWETNRIAEGSGHLHDDPAARRAIAAGKRWPEVPWNPFTCADFNGDGHLLYPGPGGHPIASIRLECIRDGIEDYELLYTLKSLLAEAEKRPGMDQRLLDKARELVQIPNHVVRSFTEYTQEPEVLLAARREVAHTVEKLSHALR